MLSDIFIDSSMLKLSLIASLIEMDSSIELCSSDNLIDSLILMLSEILIDSSTLSLIDSLKEMDSSIKLCSIDCDVNSSLLIVSEETATSSDVFISVAGVGINTATKNKTIGIIIAYIFL